MTYKQNDVFLNAEDCEKIAPYIPKALFEGWEWWWLGNDIVNISKRPLEYTKVPALDVGILGRALCGVKTPESISILIEKNEVEIVRRADAVYTDAFYKYSELQNRRDAIMYLIDNGLIQEGK